MPRYLLAIDPGYTESAWLLFDRGLERVERWAKVPNADVLEVIAGHDGDVAIEMIASYGMPVGREVFETCVWIGRFFETAVQRGADEPLLVVRRKVKMHLCGNNSAKDANIRQALIDRFGPGKDAAIGRKASPGPLYGLSGDGWAALGVAVTVADGGVDNGSTIG